MNSRQAQWCVVLFVAGLSSGLAYSGTTALRSRQRAIEAAKNLQTCHVLAQRIKQLENIPQQATLGEQTAAELTRRVEQSASRAGIAAEELLRIDPQAARRVGDSSYMEQSTLLEIRQATLQQLISFLENVTAGTSELRVTSLRLRAPRATLRAETAGVGDAEIAELWTAEMALTVLVYSPQSRRPNS